VEVLILNFINWKIRLCTISECLGILYTLLDINDNEFKEHCLDYQNYVLSEYELYTQFDLFILGLTILRLTLKDLLVDSHMVVYSYSNVLNEVGVQVSILDDCEVVIKQLLYTEPAVQDGSTSSAGIYGNSYGNNYEIESLSAQLSSI
jgi:hypothetical protein